MAKVRVFARIRAADWIGGLLAGGARGLGCGGSGGRALSVQAVEGGGSVSCHDL